MSSHHVALIPHTRRQSSRDTIRDHLTEAVPTLNVIAAATPEETRDGFDEADILITMGMEDGWYDHLGDITWIQALSSGVNHYDLDAIEEAGTILTNAAGVHAKPIAQQVLGYMLMFERNLLQAMHQQVSGDWERFPGGELDDKTVGIVGLGSIGRQVARYCQSFGMDVIGTKRDIEVELEDVDRLYPPEALEEVLVAVDYLVLACPLTDETRGLLDRDAIDHLDDDAVVINIARGEVAVEKDLIRALQNDELGGAGLDVFEEEPLPDDSPLWELPNVIITPHMAGSTPHYWQRCVDLFTANYPLYEAGSYDEMDNRIV